LSNIEQPLVAQASDNRTDVQSLAKKRVRRAARAGWSGAQPVVIRDAETETLLRTFATPLLRAAGLDPNLVRIT
jgi:hypothetical protein